MDSYAILLEADAMFGFMLAFARVLSVLKSGYPAESIGFSISPRFAVGYHTNDL
jgi:hypothetical protein